MNFWLVVDFPGDEVVSVLRSPEPDSGTFEVLSLATNGQWVADPGAWLAVQTEPGYDLVDEETALSEVQRIRSQPESRLTPA